MSLKSTYRVLIAAYDEIMSPTLPLLARVLIGDRTGEIILMGVVVVPEGHNLSEGAAAAQARRQMLSAIKRRYADLPLRVKPRIRVGHTTWHELIDILSNEQIDMLLLAWNGDTASPLLGVSLETILSEAPCDVALVRGASWQAAKRILLPVRGGPYAALAVSLAMSIAKANDGEITLLNAAPADQVDRNAQVFISMLEQLPRSCTIHVESDVISSILQQEAAHDLIVMGASSRPVEATPQPLGAITVQVAGRTQHGLIVVKSSTPEGALQESDVSYRKRALSILTDKWFAENTFDADEFANLEHLLELKQERGATISLGLPALNEAKTVGKVIRTLQRALMKEVPLLDEIVLIDSGSEDRTREIARRHGVPVYIHQEILPQHGAHHGKGEALWKSLYVLKGDLIAWIDTDIKNIHPRFVYGVLGPLLLHDRIQYVKGFYRRPMRVGDKLQAGGGGRVTELVTRPMFNLFFPELSGLVQPLSGEYAGRRAAFEALPFFTGYGVETGLLIDILNRFELRAIAQTNLLERIHHSQALAALSKMSFTILQVIMQRLEQRRKLHILEEINRNMKLIRYEADRYFLDIEELTDFERPPIITLPEYIARYKSN